GDCNEISAPSAPRRCRPRRSPGTLKAWPEFWKYGSARGRRAVARGGPRNAQGAPEQHDENLEGTLHERGGERARKHRDRNTVGDCGLETGRTCARVFLASLG